MPDAAIAPADAKYRAGGVMLADGTFFEGVGFGAVGSVAGEVCFNTAMTGYQEILSDPSYAGQIVAFTFPHIGIVGTNDEDIETITPAVRGLIVRADAEHPSNYRSLAALDRWLKAHNIPAVAGIDTRALTSLIREKGMPHGAIVNCGDAAPTRLRCCSRPKAFRGWRDWISPRRSPRARCIAGTRCPGPGTKAMGKKAPRSFAPWFWITASSATF